MQIAVGWWDLSVPAVFMLLSVLLALLTRRWQRRRAGAVKWRSRTHWEWLPFMFGLTVMIIELPRVLGAPESVVSICDTLAGVFGLTAVFMIARWILMLCVRGIRLMFRR